MPRSVSTTENVWLLIFQSANHHLEDARQILALPDGGSYLLQQAQPLELRLELALRGLPLGDVVEEGHPKRKARRGRKR